jgi:hypothetical protein
MKKIVITSFIMPHELDDLERVLVDLNKASKYIKGENYSFYISLSVSDYLIDWNNSKVDKQFFIDRFNSLKSLTNWAGSSVMQIREEIMGAFQCKRYAHKEITDATHFIWLDTDICFDDKILYYMEASIDRLQQTDPNVDKYFITPEIVKYWDTTWDCLVNSNYLNKPLDYCKTNNPFAESGEVDDVELETVFNNVPGQPQTKFGAGWFTLLSKPLLDRIPLPESMGAYGPDDTFLMWAIEKLNQSGANIYQFKLKNYIVCENYIYRNRKHYDTIISRIDRKEEFKKQSYSVFQNELNKIV